MATDAHLVLYVEDEEIDRFLMERAFGKAGLPVALRMVDDGQAALDYLSGAGEYSDREKHPVPAVVLLDLNLPEVHGFDVLKWIRSQSAYPELPVVIFSSSEREEDQVRARSLGSNDFIKKPGSGLDFVEVVRNFNQRWVGAARQKH